MTISTQLVTITPEQARQWLQQNKNNRAVRISKVTALAKHMRDGTFHTTHQGIALFEDGTLADGQHRLAAIVYANKPVQMLVTFGLSTKEAEAVDYEIAPRRMHDVFCMSASDTPLTNKHAVAVIRVLLRKFQPQNSFIQQTIGDVEKYYRTHQTAIDTVFRLVPLNHSRWSNSIIVAAYVTAIASKGVTESSVVRFHQVLSTGQYDSGVAGEGVAILLRNLMIKLGQNAFRNANTAATAKKAQRALQCVDSGENITSLREQSTFIWPVPELPLQRCHDRDEKTGHVENNEVKKLLQSLSK